MESTEQHRFKVGLFLLVGLIAFVTSVLVLDGEGSLFKKFVKIKATMTQVQGLNQGSVVSLSGYTIGNVEEIVLQENGKDFDVTMKIQESYLPKIAANSLVDLRTQGALGDKYIFIIQGDLTKGGLTADARLAQVAATDILSVLAERGSEAGRVFDLINESLSIAKGVNKEARPEKIVASIDRIAQSMEKTAKNTEILIAELRQSHQQQIVPLILEFKDIAKKINRGDGPLGTLIQDQNLANKIKSFAGESGRKKYLRSTLEQAVEGK